MPSDSYRATLALPPNAIVVPVVKQVTSYSCGAAATLSTLRLWRPDAFGPVVERSLFAALDTTEAHGTEPEPMVEVLQRQGGLSAEYRHGDVTLAHLERAVDAGEPPIVDLQAWRDDDRPWRETWNAGHYVILVAYDRDKLYVMDPSVLTPGGFAYLPRADLDERWHDLAGPANVHLERMVIFVRGSGPRWQRPAASQLDRDATRLD